VKSSISVYLVTSRVQVTIYENVTVGTTLHRFSATDSDTGLNRLFTYVYLSLYV